MIELDSILRRLPIELHQKEALFLDGIRHAVEMAHFSYQRLKSVLTDIATREHPPDQVDSRYTAAFIDAWCFVDSVDRLRALWIGLPTLEEEDTAVHTIPFRQFAQPIRDLRNVADHLPQRADYVVARDGAALGVLTWFTTLSADPLAGVSCTVVPGSVTNRNVHTVNPAGRKIEFPTGLVHLAAGEYRVNLSDYLPEIRRRIKALERGLKSKVENHSLSGEHFATDLLVKMNLSFGTEIPPTSKDTA